MTVRQKIALLITAAGFLSSLLFSGIILWEMLEQPFAIMDSELNTTIQRVSDVFSKASEMIRNNNSILDDALLVDGEHQWISITDRASGETAYRSRLARQVDIPEPAPGESATAKVAIQLQNQQQSDRQNKKTAFRIKSALFSIGKKEFLVCAGITMEKLDEEIQDIIIGVVGGLVFSVLFLMVLSYFIAGAILKPVRIINGQTRDITEKNLHLRIPVGNRRDEFGQLARTLNKVFDRLQTAFLKQKRLIADASHELKTPLTLMRLTLEEARSNREDNRSPLCKEDLDRLTDQALRMQRLVKNLLDLSQLENESGTAKNPIDLAEILTSLIADYQFLADMQSVSIETRFSPNLMVNGDKEKLNRAFSNLLDNALKYNVKGGKVEIWGNQSNGFVSLVMANTGPGVPESEIPKLFDQFFRVEKSRSVQHGGSGLGLAIVKRIVELHDGMIQFESKQDSLTQVSVLLPAAGEGKSSA